MKMISPIPGELTLSLLRPFTETVFFTTGILYY
jgi:hypothetical protein